jgi:hypothetical protein
LLAPSGPVYWTEYQSVFEPLKVDVPPWGWRQLNALEFVAAVPATVEEP